MRKFQIASATYDVHEDVAAILRVAEGCAVELGGIADRFGVALESPEDEVAAAASARCEEALSTVLASASSNSMRSLGGGLGLMACWFRVVKNPDHFSQLMNCVAHIAAVNSTRFLQSQGARNP
jgi:hypothetical protein